MHFISHMYAKVAVGDLPKGSGDVAEATSPLPSGNPGLLFLSRPAANHCPTVAVPGGQAKNGLQQIKIPWLLDVGPAPSLH